MNITRLNNIDVFYEGKVIHRIFTGTMFVRDLEINETVDSNGFTTVSVPRPDGNLGFGMRFANRSNVSFSYRLTFCGARV